MLEEKKMDAKFLISIFAVMVLLTSCFGCIQWPLIHPQNNTTNPPTIQTGGGDSGGPSGAQKCPNCGYYPWYVGTRWASFIAFINIKGDIVPGVC